MSFVKDLEKYMKKGKIRKTMSDKIDIRTFRILYHSLQWVSVGYSSALYFAGKKLGKQILSKYIKGNDLKTVFKEIKRLFSSFGIGKIEISGIEDKKATIILKDCSTCYHMIEIGKPVCFFESGMIAGIVEAKHKGRVSVNETLCGGLGDEIDEFMVRF